MARILSTHVGSLPRPQDAVDFLFARERGEEVDGEAFEACMAKAVSEAVRRQREAGIDIVSDGEMSKISYATYVADRYSGFSGDSPRQAPADLKRYPGFLKRLAESGGTPTYRRPMCTGEVKPKNHDALDADIARLKAAMVEHGVEEGFLNAASPGVVALFQPNGHYPDENAYLEALADALGEEYRRIVDAGLLLQVDCPDLALARHMKYAEMNDGEFVRTAGRAVEALNHALRGVEPARVRAHICWGNYEGPHVCDIGMEKTLDLLLAIRCRYVLFETSNPRHGHEWTVFRDRAGDIPEDRVLVPGVVDTTTNFVEHPELVAQRIGRFIDIVGRERVVAGSDCGFGTFAGYGAVDPEVAYAKIASIAEGARLASLGG